MRDPITQKAIDSVGGPTRLATLLDITQGAVSQWRRVPSGQVHRVARVTGIPAEKLRPDLFVLKTKKRVRA